MRCAGAQSLFSAVFDREAGSAVAEFESHLEGCGDCLQSWTEYQQDMAGVGPAMASMAQVVETWPERPLSLEALPTRRRSALFGPLGLAWGAVAAAVVGVVFLYVGDPPSRGTALPEKALDVARRVPEPAPGPESERAHGLLDPTKLVQAEFLDRPAYPVVAPTDLDRGYQLVHQEMLGAGSCPEEVRLAYGCNMARLQLDELAAAGQEQRCRGSLVKLHGRVACLDHGYGVNGYELSWTVGGRLFRVTADKVTLDEALALAREIDRHYEITLANNRAQTW